MADLNHVFLMGNLTRDPEVRYIPSGKAVADLRLAVNRRYRSSSGENREETCFVDVSAWDRQAETAGQYLKKGSSVLIEGRLKFDEWETDGEKRNRLSVVATRVQFMDRLKSPDTGDAPGAAAGEGSADKEKTRGNPEPRPADGDGLQADDDDLPF